MYKEKLEHAIEEAFNYFQLDKTEVIVSDKKDSEGFDLHILVSATKGRATVTTRERHNSEHVGPYLVDNIVELLKILLTKEIIKIYIDKEDGILQTNTGEDRTEG